VVSGYTRALEHSKHLGWNLHALLLAVNNNSDGVEVITKWTLGAIFGMRNFIANMCGAGKFECKGCHNRGVLYHPGCEAAIS